MTNSLEQPSERMLTPAEVATRLRISRTTVYGLIDSGKLIARGIGRGALRVSEEDLAAFLRSCRRGPKEHQSEEDENQ
jgi:excisionase family DNA binding protein